MADASSDRTPPSRRRLARILGLPERASTDAIRRAGDHLLRVLERRHAAAPDDDQLTREIASLRRALARHTAPGAPSPAREKARDHGRLVAGLALAAGILLVFLLWTSAEPERVALGEAEDARAPALGGPGLLARPGRGELVVVGSLGDATLRVLDADRSTVLRETRAQDAVLELRRGRYALEVTRPGCEDRWTRSVYIEPARRLRVEPSVCSGRGRLRLRTNVEGGLLSIDGEPQGVASPAPVELAAGEHAVRIEKSGYRPFASTIRIRSDQTLDLRADLLPAGPSGEGAERVRRALAAGLGAPIVAREDLPEPEPFDLGDLQAEIAPKRDPLAGTRLLERRGLGRLPDGGSTAWHDRVSREFVARFDVDGSGRIDRVDESEAISCAYWRETEESFERGGLGLSMARYYGFDGSEWHPGALGFDRAIRSAVYARMRACGLQARRPSDTKSRG